MPECLKSKKSRWQNSGPKTPIALNEETDKSFLKEIKVWEKLRHPNITQVYDVNIMPLPYIEMEYAENKSLQELKKPLDIVTADGIILGILRVG